MDPRVIGERSDAVLRTAMPAGDGENVSEHTPHRHGAFFGRRKGHPLRQRQAALFDTLLPKLALDLSKPAPSDLRSLFRDVDELRVESGFGGGEHLVAEAERNPRTGFIGI